MDGLANAIAHDPRHGVDVTIDGDQICVDLYIIIEYGTVNVHVQDLRVSNGS
jgi:uncharacterized alkaline shock family protein YloU